MNECCRKAVEEALTDAEIEWLKQWSPQVEADIAKASAEAYADAAKICDERIEDEMRIAMGTKGQGKFQCQAAIDALGEVSEAIRARAKEPMTPNKRYQELKDITENFKYQNRIHHHFLRILAEAVEEARLAALEDALGVIGPCWQQGVPGCECPACTYSQRIRALKSLPNVVPAAPEPKP